MKLVSVVDMSEKWWAGTHPPGTHIPNTEPQAVFSWLEDYLGSFEKLAILYFIITKKVCWFPGLKLPALLDE